MTILIKTAALFAALVLTGCSQGEKPRAAELIAATPAFTDFGDLRVRYNALPTLSLSEAIARESGVARDADTAMLVVALRTLSNGDEIPAEGEVQAVATDLQGVRQSIVLRAARTGGYTDHIGTFRIASRDSYRIDVSVTANGSSRALRFQRGF